MIKLYQGNQEIQFSITTFPDQTSQVWKLDPVPTANNCNLCILWLFESELELVYILQLAYLLRNQYKANLKLKAPYLPYARQDKEVSNSSTWALHFFAKLMKEAEIDEVEVFDQHSPRYFKLQSAEAFHRSVISHDVVCFPDKGARARYPHLYSYPYVYCEKTRNQQTGEITGMVLETQGLILSGKKFIIVDDLCDGGQTFIEVAKRLQEHDVTHIDLAVSHGLFSKGKDLLFAAGLKTIFTTNSIIKNADSFKVW